MSFPTHGGGEGVFSAVRDSVSFPLAYTITVWILPFRCMHDFTSLCTRASLHASLVVRVPKQAVVRCTISLYVLVSNAVSLCDV